MSVIASGWIQLRFWYRRSQMEITMGALIAIAFMGWNVRSNFDADTHLHAQDCDSARTRFLDSTNFWSSKGHIQSENASAKYAARDLWVRISGELGKAQSPGLQQDISDVAARWQDQGDHDRDDSGLDYGNVQTIQKDFNRSCGPAPTPLPTVPSSTPMPMHKLQTHR